MNIKILDICKVAENVEKRLTEDLFSDPDLFEKNLDAKIASAISNAREKNLKNADIVIEQSTLPVAKILFKKELKDKILKILEKNGIRERGYIILTNLAPLKEIFPKNSICMQIDKRNAKNLKEIFTKEEC